MPRSEPSNQVNNNTSDDLTIKNEITMAEKSIFLCLLPVFLSLLPPNLTQDYPTSLQCPAECTVYNVLDNSTVIYKVQVCAGRWFFVLFHIKIQIQGRLGNQMMGYAMMLTLRKLFNLQTFLEPEVVSALQRYFVNIDQIPTWDSLCRESYPWTTFMSAPALLNQSEYREGSAFELPVKV